VADVHLYGGFRDKQLAADLAVRKPSGYMRENFTLARRQFFPGSGFARWRSVDRVEASYVTRCC
jgi:hypothetical protein